MSEMPKCVKGDDYERYGNKIWEKMMMYLLAIIMFIGTMQPLQKVNTEAAELFA